MQVRRSGLEGSMRQAKRWAATAAGIAVGLGLTAGSAGSQGNYPNPLQGDNTTAGCSNWQAEMAANDPQAMQRLVGVWQGEGMVPGTPGVVGDTPIQIRTTISANGAFQVERYGCFQMLSVPGMPSLPPSCATSLIYGQWGAHFAEGGWIAMISLASGSGFNGQALPMTCNIAYLQAPDGNTLIDPAGGRAQRIGN
jgi:hypothetical protein